MEKQRRGHHRTDNPRQTLSDLLDARAPVYALADLVVHSQPGYSVIDMARAVMAELQTRADVLEGSSE